MGSLQKRGGGFGRQVLPNQEVNYERGKGTVPGSIRRSVTGHKRKRKGYHFSRKTWRGRGSGLGRMNEKVHERNSRFEEKIQKRGRRNVSKSHG